MVGACRGSALTFVILSSGAIAGSNRIGLAQNITNHSAPCQACSDLPALALVQEQENLERCSFTDTTRIQIIECASDRQLEL